MRSRNWMHLTGTLLILLLMAAHVFHLHAARERSKTAIIDAVFDMSDAMRFQAAMDAGTVAMYQERLSRQIHSEGGGVPGFRSLVYVSNGNLYLSFALLDETMAGAVLGRMEKELQAGPGTKAPNLQKTNTTVSCVQAGKPGVNGKDVEMSSLKLSQFDVRHLPWIKPLDVIVLLVLSGALGIWFRKARGD